MCLNLSKGDKGKQDKRKRKWYKADFLEICILIELSLWLYQGDSIALKTVFQNLFTRFGLKDQPIPK